MVAFAAIGELLNLEIDRECRSIESEFAKETPENYDLKLSNTLHMVGMLDAESLSQSMAAVRVAIAPFSRDPVARAAIEANVRSKLPGQAPTLFDDSRTERLARLEKMRTFADPNRFAQGDLAINFASFLQINGLED
ncbi:hypothetical protein LJC33_08125 [Eubacteriales bacterium OttesenSCG-928-N13]|nr:hypothetical protein [Eubacteriales bacterium OttesenSCG-928-N13]